MYRSQHTKIFNAYLSQLTPTQLDQLNQIIHNCWHAAVNSSINAQITAGNDQLNQIQEIVDLWNEDDVKNIDKIIEQEFNQQKTLMLTEIDKQINQLEQEQIRCEHRRCELIVKQWINESGFDCTSAPWIMAREYRKALKDHLMNLKLNRKEIR